MEMITLRDEDVMVKLPKRPMLVGHKMFKKEEDVSRVKKVNVKACGTI
jgi:hypothetical protein